VALCSKFVAPYMLIGQKYELSVTVHVVAVATGNPVNANVIIIIRLLQCSLRQ
jgi:hypothetical protein